MNRYFHVIYKKGRHAWLMARNVLRGVGIAGYGWREADARLAEALVELERENLYWAMHVHDHSTVKDHKRGE
ncbi:hypothetical protein DM813_28055 [Pseudomonas alkylphenolica]|uniref:Uncharacterized protein n=1 Tax=Pseudomonas alkylphenolica TaxID=237609 RepID=A0A443ZEU0_9PSED|nr:hypothetical protein [Pseudomonas alkylphenolica]RWU17215.1 hypothetical protein DM813_28055 [Pseudomonas alkylphenolica]